jgi:tetratricopeptide (TPR) repeat protein
MRPLCFVLMPFGTKPSGSGGSIDFDAVYRDVIAPAIEAADLDVLRADEEQCGGFIHKPMYERLILCEFAVADLTTANANVFYELGLRHATRRHSTVAVFAEGGRLPFDVNGLRALPYTLTADGKPDQPSVAIERLAAALTAAKRHADTDSPLYQLVQDYPNIQREKTDVFRDRVEYSATAKKRLAAARKLGVDAIRAEERTLGDIEDADAAIVVDLMLSYRAVKGWDDMVALVERMARPLAATVMVQEQLGLALNRAGRGDEAEQVLTTLIDRRGPSSETYGILGRVYKDRWEDTLEKGDVFAAAGLLDHAIDAYLKGFEADWRDAYPGVNAVTLMELKDPPDARRVALIPVVAYAVERRIAAGKPDYWDHATQLELAVLGKDEAVARTACGKALALVREKWEPETTVRNLRLIREGRARRGEVLAWTDAIERALEARSK